MSKEVPPTPPVETTPAVGTGVRSATSTAQTARVEFDDGQSTFLLDGTNLVGRDPTARIRLVDGRVSRQHAELVCSRGMCRVRDLHSTNGTFVNGLRVDDHVLVDRDVVDFGGVKLRFRV